ncbi:MAG: TetR/AcrR family transcriptional regulator [Alphaproteobacteria bacterium]|nr:TetR/AcrR family transcriptional regulator [Alphaproteobacteria bacterium]
MPDTHNISDERRKILEDALALSAEIGWDNVSFRELSRKSGTSLAELYAHYEDKTQLLFEYEKMLNRKVLENAGEGDPGSSARDRLFDILMERFEVMNAHREALIAIWRTVRLDPKQAVIGMPHLAASMAWMLEAADIDTGGLRGAVKVAGLTGVYLKVLREWLRDDSPDLGATMAALDRTLSRAEQAANTFGI